MHLVHKKCGSRVRNQMVCPVCKVVVDRSDLVRGFEVSKGKYVQITEEELESLEAEANNGIEFREFVPVEKIDPVYFESSYYLAPSKGAENLPLNAWNGPAHRKDNEPRNRQLTATKTGRKRRKA